MENKKRRVFRSVMAILLSVTTMVAFFPLLGDAGVYAADQNDKSGEVYYALPGEGEDGFVSADDALTKDELNVELKGQKQAGAAQAITNGAISVEDEIVSAQEVAGRLPADEAVADIEPVLGQAVFSEDKKTDAINAMGEIDEDEDSDLEEGEETSSYQNVECEGTRTYDPKTGRLTIDNVKILTPGVYITAIYVDNDEIYYDADWNEIAFDKTTEIDQLAINMKDYDIGYHTIWLVTGTDDPDAVYTDLFFNYVPTQIYDKPVLKLADITSGYNYFSVYNENSNYYEYGNYDYSYYDGVGLDFKKAKSGWSIGWGPIDSFSTVKSTGRAAASTYYTRIYYIKNTQYYDPETGLTDNYLFKGSETGAYSSTVGFKTAYKYTPVKSVTAKKVKQWCKKVKVLKLSSKIYWRYGYAGYGPYRKVLGKKTYKYWYTKVKITVTMKKKPGIAGVYIGSKTVKGNKTSYSANFTLSGKKKGKKIKVSVYSYMSSVYGGLSGKVLKTVKVK